MVSPDCHLRKSPFPFLTYLVMSFNIHIAILDEGIQTKVSTQLYGNL